MIFQMNQRKQALLFFFVMVFVSIGIVIYHFWLNRGTVVVVGDYPFTVSLGPLQEKLCENEAACHFTVSPKKYRLIARKEDYFNVEEDVTVKRWQSQEKKLRFFFRPKIQTLGREAASPLKEAEILGPIFPSFDKVDISKIPRQAKKIIFTSSQKFAIVYIGKETFLYDGSGPAAFLTKISLQKISAIVSGRKNDVFFLLENIEGGQRLSKFDVSAIAPLTGTTGKSETLTRFERPLRNPSLHPSPHDKKILVQEKSGSGESVFYLIDTAAKMKRKITLPVALQRVRWLSENWIAYDLLENGKLLVKFFSFESREAKPLDAEHAWALSRLDEKRIIVVSENPPEGQEKRISFSEAFEIAKENLEELKKPREKAWYFIEKNLESGEEKLLALLVAGKDEAFGQTDYEVRNGKLFFSTIEGGELKRHVLVLEKPFM